MTRNPTNLAFSLEHQLSGYVLAEDENSRFGGMVKPKSEDISIVV